MTFDILYLPLIGWIAVGLIVWFVLAFCLGWIIGQAFAARDEPITDEDDSPDVWRMWEL